MARLPLFERRLDDVTTEDLTRLAAVSEGWYVEFKRQVPPIAKLGPRTAGVDYLYPRRRPGSSRA